MSKRQVDSLPATPVWLRDFLFGNEEDLGMTGANIVSFAKHIGLDGDDTATRCQAFGIVEDQYDTTAAARMIEVPFVAHYRTTGKHLDYRRFVADFASWPPIANRVAYLKAERAKAST